MYSRDFECRSRIDCLIFLSREITQIPQTFLILSSCIRVCWQLVEKTQLIEFDRKYMNYCNATS